MLKGPIYIEITEFAKNPICTGIQRVEREILQNWCGPNSLIPCIYNTQRQEFIEVDATSLQSIMEHKGDDEAGKTLIGHGIHHARGIATSNVLSNLFNPEVFFDPVRAQKYIEWISVKDTRISWLVYDFMPFLYPEHYPVGTRCIACPIFSLCGTFPA